MPHPPKKLQKPWNNWYHCTGSTYGSWLRGDPKGWRSRHHREHVQGDYKNPPPAGTYTKLHNYSKFIMKKDAIILTWPQRLAAAKKMIEALHHHNVQIIDLCVSPTHFHTLCRFTPIENSPNPPSPGIAIPGSKYAHTNPPPYNPNASKIRTPRHLIGIAKKESARTLSQLALTRPGGLWALRCKCKPIRNRHHQLRVTKYIPAHQKRGAAVYSLHLTPKKSP